MGEDVVRLRRRAELPATSTSTEDTHAQNWTFDHDTLGQPTHAGIDGSNFNFEHHFDESGNVLSSTTPSRRGETRYDYDARSFNTDEHLPVAKNPNHYDPDASGALARHTDPTGEPTKTTNDGLGRQGSSRISGWDFRRDPRRRRPRRFHT